MHYSIREVSGKSSMAVCKVGISHSIWRVDSIPWIRWNNVKPMANLASMR
jgi:hypothetical protein